MSKSAWKRAVMDAVDERDHARWRFSLTLFAKLDTFRAVVWNCEPVCWWILSKTFPFLKRPCITMVTLLCGCSILARYKSNEIPREQRVCQMCNRDEVEDIVHFLLYCPRFVRKRECLFSSIEMGLSYSALNIWNDLSPQVKVNVMLGMEFTFSCEDRSQSYPHPDMYMGS